MNTESLQNNFRSIYEDFFAKNDLVVSGNHSFPLNLGFGENKDKLHIRKKIPTKTYCGINSIKERKIEFKDTYFFDILEQRFDSVNFNDINKQAQKIKDYLLGVLDDFGYEKGLSISFLSESPRGHGLAFSGTIASLIATGIFLILKKIDKNVFKNYDDFISSQEFKQIFSLGLEIERISRYGNSIGNNCYCAMMNTQLPTISFSREETPSESPSNLICNYKIKDFLGIQNGMDEINLDYGIVFSGISNKVEHRKHQYDNHSEGLNILESSFKDLLNNKGIKDIKSFPFKNLFENGFHQAFKDIAFIYNIKTLSALKRLLENGFKEDIIDEFIQTQKENNYISSMIEGNNHMTNSFNLFFDELKKFDHETIAIYPSNFLNIGGSFVFVSKFNKSRSTMLEVMKRMKEIGYEELSLEYASWLDGVSDDGISLEQWISSSIFSDYIKKDLVYYKDNKGKIFLGNYNEILTQSNDGLLCDMIHNKIYLNGKKITSSQLCSQTATIDILYKLVEYIGQDVNNKELEISSYSKNKNEMLGKIVIPFISLIEKETGERFPLICKGSIYDFYMKLNPSIIKIAFVKKI